MVLSQIEFFSQNPNFKSIENRQNRFFICATDFSSDDKVWSSNMRLRLIYKSTFLGE